jgi:hypothetical protein
MRSRVAALAAFTVALPCGAYAATPTITSFAPASGPLASSVVIHGTSLTRFLGYHRRHDRHIQGDFGH